jgi:hypothetical protein
MVLGNKVDEIRQLLQISIVKKGEPRETRELFRELALLQVP